MVHPLFTLSVRIAAAAAAAGVVAYLFARSVVPGGVLMVTTDLVRPAPFVSQPKPSERMEDPERDAAGRMLTPMIGDPVYFDVTPPSAFETIEMAVRFENNGHPVVGLGALGSTLDEQFVLRPGSNRTIDGLSWRRVSGGVLTLLQRTPRYASLEEFFAEPPPRSKVAVHHATFGVQFVMPGYAPLGASRDIEVSLRGNHRMLTYVKDEPLSFSFSTQDMNRQDGADPVIVSVYREGSEEPVARAVLEDDGNAVGDQRASGLRTVAVSVASPDEGVYKIEFTAPADVFIRRIATRQRKLVFAGRVYVGDHVGYSDRTDPLTLYTAGRRVAARTAHAEGLQTIDVGGKGLRLEHPHSRAVQFVPPGSGIIAVTTPKRDVLIETDGTFALSRDDHFDPGPYAMTWYTTKEDLDALGIDFILTTYEPPAREDGIEVIRAEFPTDRLALTKEGAYRFVVTAPGIAETHRELRIASVTFTMRREPMTWRNAFPRLLSVFAARLPPAPLVLPDGTSYGESPH